MCRGSISQARNGRPIGIARGIRWISRRQRPLPGSEHDRTDARSRRRSVDDPGAPGGVPWHSPIRRFLCRPRYRPTDSDGTATQARRCWVDDQRALSTAPAALRLQADNRRHRVVTGNRRSGAVGRRAFVEHTPVDDLGACSVRHRTRTGFLVCHVCNNVRPGGHPRRAPGARSLNDRPFLGSRSEALPVEFW